MIVVDASALLAIYLGEPEREAFQTAIRGAGGGLITPVNAWEALVRARAVHGEAGQTRMSELMSVLGLVTPACTITDVFEAVDAFARFGRRSQAGLNLGDCFAYGMAHRYGLPLLFKGEDFRRTDVLVAR